MVLSNTSHVALDLLLKGQCPFSFFEQGLCVPLADPSFENLGVTRKEIGGYSINFHCENMS